MCTLYLSNETYQEIKRVRRGVEIEINSPFEINKYETQHIVSVYHEQNFSHVFQSRAYFALHTVCICVLARKRRRRKKNSNSSEIERNVEMGNAQSFVYCKGILFYMMLSLIHTHTLTYTYTSVSFRISSSRMKILYTH